MSAVFTVYFDGACPLCRREIGFYRRRRGAERIRWVDVGRSACEVVDDDLCRREALSRFHVRLADGRLVSGARAFAELWSQLPGWRALGRCARLPAVTPLLEAAYRAFLRVRPVLQTLAEPGPLREENRLCKPAAPRPEPGAPASGRRAPRTPASSPTAPKP